MGKFREVDPIGMEIQKGNQYYTANDDGMINVINSGDIFLRTKKSKGCGIIIADSKEMRVLITGFKRDKIRIALHHHWLNNTEMKEAENIEEKAANKIIKCN